MPEQADADNEINRTQQGIGQRAPVSSRNHREAIRPIPDRVITVAARLRSREKRFFGM